MLYYKLSYENNAWNLKSCRFRPRTSLLTKAVAKLCHDICGSAFRRLRAWSFSTTDKLNANSQAAKNKIVCHPGVRSCSRVIWCNPCARPGGMQQIAMRRKFSTKEERSSNVRRRSPTPKILHGNAAYLRPCRSSTKDLSNRSPKK
jgi:hypothetical protein